MSKIDDQTKDIEENTSVQDVPSGGIINVIHINRFCSFTSLFVIEYILLFLF